MSKSFAFWVAKGYAVQSAPVKAFMNVFSERRVIMKKGSRTGKRRLPQSAVCSRMCATPVESWGTVRNATRKALLVSAAARCTCRARVGPCRYSSTVRLSESTRVLRRCWKKVSVMGAFPVVWPLMESGGGRRAFRRPRNTGLSTRLQKVR